jgi:hypothetical protein
MATIKVIILAISLFDSVGSRDAPIIDRQSVDADYRSITAFFLKILFK